MMKGYDRKVVLAVSIILAGSAIFLLSRCATIVRGTEQDVRFSSSPANARVVVDGEDRGKTPTTLTMGRDDDYQVVFQKEGYQNQTVNIDQEFTIGWPIFGNIFSWGLIGIIVDVANGAAYQLTPEQVEAALSEAEVSRLHDQFDGQGIHVVLLTKEQVGGRVDLSQAVPLPR